MNFDEILQELSRLTVQQRQLLIRTALELDEPAVSETDEVVENPPATAKIQLHRSLRAK